MSGDGGAPARDPTSPEIAVTGRTGGLASLCYRRFARAKQKYRVRRRPVTDL